MSEQTDQQLQQIDKLLAWLTMTDRRSVIEYVQNIVHST